VEEVETMPIAGPALNKPFHLGQILKRGLEAKPQELALVSALTRWTWKELDQASDQLAVNLLRLGLKVGDRVASLMPNRAALLIHYLSCMKAGVVATPLNYRYTPPEIDHALEVSQASILFAHAERSQDLAVSTCAGALPLGFVSYGGSLGLSPSFEDLVKGERPGFSLPPPDPKAPAFIFFTSGSTGKPKGVTHSQETFGWMIASLMKGLEMTDKDILLPGSSISHIGSLLFSFTGLAAGARVDVARTFDGDEILPLLRDTRPTILVMLPAALFTLVRDHLAKPEDFHSLRYCFSGGDKVSAELEREFTQIAGLPIHEGYGMTEMCPITMNPARGLNKLGSVGIVAHSCEISIRDDSGLEVEHGVEGRLWAKSPCKMIGFWENPVATQKVLRDGWLDTGDLMKADEDGYLWFCGRKKQIIVHDGSNICPQEVEEALLQHALVDNAGVVGVHHLIHGENVRAYITIKDEAVRPTSQELIQFARARVGYKAPEEIVFLAEMPLNATGKVDRVTLKKMAAKQHAVIGSD
jgi:acyl-coenzyme A synthetase/AMP-(fatty) acid ligase